MRIVACCVRNYILAGSVCSHFAVFVVFGAKSLRCDDEKRGTYVECDASGLEASYDPTLARVARAPRKKSP